jgi:hypothetical protein
MTNPLQNYFRQPKIYIQLPSKGAFTTPGTIQGDTNKLPIYGMTGMDEIVMKTPDALLSGESVVKVIESCCPSIKNAWEIATIDMNLLIVAIRIATYGNMLSVTHKCTKCDAENDYEFDLVKIIEYYATAVYDNVINLEDLTIRLKPLNYKQMTDMSLRSFQIQQQVTQIIRSVPEGQDPTAENNKQIQDFYRQLAALQNEIYILAVESVETKDINVTESKYIKEWLENSDATIFDQVKSKNQANSEQFVVPAQSVECAACHSQTEISVEFDQASFFAKA